MVVVDEREWLVVDRVLELFDVGFGPECFEVELEAERVVVIRDFVVLLLV